MRLPIISALILLLTLARPAFAETRLMMVEEGGCAWCIRWNKEVGGKYALTVEGKTAPLWRHDISAPLPEGVTLTSQPQYTPTFILLVDGTEVNRIEGYPGEGFFWGLLEIMLTSLPEAEGSPSES